MIKKPYTYIVAGNVVALFRGETQLAGYDVVVDELNMQAETIRCQQLVLDQIAQALGLEPGDVDGIGAAIGELIVDRDAAVMQLRDERNAASEIEGLKNQLNSSKPLIKVFLLEGHEPFICAISGALCGTSIDNIEKQLLEDGCVDWLNQGEGEYIYRATYDDAVMESYEPYWELDLIEFKALAAGEAGNG